MDLAAKITFWASIVLLLYTYVGYGVVLTSLVWLRPGKKRSVIVKNPDYAPKVSVIVAAYNEERVIEQRIRNLLELDFPKDKLEIIIASDGSIDNTARIARSYESQGVRVLDFKIRRGRAPAHNDAVQAATGEILVFTDAETVFEPDFLRKAVAYLGDDRYGCGSGDFSFEPLGTIGQTESLYWRMDKTLRMQEYQLGILPFASGGCLVIRKALFVRVPERFETDCFLPYIVVQNGYKIFYAFDAKAYDVTVSNIKAHYRKRVRSALQAMDGILSALPGLVLRRKFSIVWVMISHRLLRWFGAYLLLSALLANAWLVGRGMTSYNILLAGQLAFYILGFIGWLEEELPHAKYRLPLKLHNVALSFILSNAAFIQATIKLAKGETIGGRYDPASHS